LRRATQRSSPSPKLRSDVSGVPDVLDTDLRVVFCGINPGRVSAAAGAHFANPRNDFWRLLHAAGFTSRPYEPHEQRAVLAEGIGLTNAAYRTTPGSGDLRRADFADSPARLERLARDLRPRWLAFVGKEAYRGAFGERAELGHQERRLAETDLFVLPSTSPANAAVPWEERRRWFRELAALSEPIPRPGVRAVMLDGADRILLFRYPTPGDPGVWVGPGGAVEPGETDEEALRREIDEETHVRDVEIGPWIWTRRHVWAWRGKVYDTRERFALVRVDATRVQPDSSDSLFFGGPDTGFEHRWWTLEELHATRDRLSPRRLATVLSRLLEQGPPPDQIDVGV
jgi:TDG/mug DNA glycosylase family protein